MAMDFDELVRNLENESPKVCRDAVIALEKLGDARAAKPLIAVLRHKNWGVRMAAARALGQLGDARTVELIATALSGYCPKLILAVEDHEPMLAVIQGILATGGGYIVFTATDGVEALQIMEEVRPDLIVADIMMPTMDGYVLYREVRARPEWASIPIIFLTGKAEKADVLMGKDMGVEGYLTKPFDFKELLAEVTTVLRGVRLGIYEEVTQGSKGLEDVEFLANQVKQLRKQQADLRRRLGESEERSKAASNRQLPLAEFSRLTGGLVHDMRSGLGVISNTIGFLQDDLADTAHQSDLLKISRSLDFCELVLRNLSALGGQDLFQPRWINLEAIVREVCFLLERKLVDVELIIDIDPDVPKILADEGQMKQVFMNLIKNAGEAMPDGGTLTVRTRREGQMLRVEVSDTGYGISQENQGRLFQEFFTTKPQGYGLGLHIVNTIVKRHGGTIAVESKVGEGTTFTLRLPIEPE